MGTGRDLHAMRKDGKEFPVEVSLTYYRYDGRVYAIAFIIDITVRKNSEAMVLAQKNELERITSEIRQLNIELEQKVEDRTKMLRETLAELEKSQEELHDALKAERELGELKSRFVTMASHEFRTPLSAILSSAYLLEQYNDKEEPAKRLKHIQRIKTAVGDLRGILEDFLSLGKLEEGLVQSKPEAFAATALDELVREWIAEVALTCKPGQTFGYTFEGEGHMKTDRHLLKNILLNLLSNASKFSREQALIQVQATLGNHGLTLRVKDQGIGISRDDLQHLTERFFRAKNALNIQGTGLGLHIIVKYLNLLGGNMQVESELDKGSTFTIYIPDHEEKDTDH
jgi:signal transduction histidine kinase